MKNVVGSRTLVGIILFLSLETLMKFQIYFQIPGASGVCHRRVLFGRGLAVPVDP